MKGPHRQLADSEVEHVAVGIWCNQEDGKSGIEYLGQTSRVEDVDAAIQALAARGLARTTETGVELTASGRDLAQRVVRRHRLAELLFSSVLDIKDDRVVNRTACVIEHVISAEATDSVCSFLGHPKFCPHGKPIPAGECCRSFSSSIEPLVQRLDMLAVGDTARIAYIVPRDPERLVRLSNLGVVPGATVRMRQKRPATVIAIGETTLAVDREISEEVYVKKVK